MRSSFMGVKCALAVKRSITARTSRAAAEHEARADTPAKPSPRKTRIETKRMSRTSTLNPRPNVNQRRSKMPAAPMPPPIHMVTMP
jgi:hypothetical protein